MTSPGPSLTAIVVACHDVAGLASTLDSLLAESRPPREVLVAGDAASAPSAAVVEAYARRRPEVAWLRDHVDRLAALDVALRAATGDYVHVLSAGDVVVQGAYERVAALAEQAPGVVLGQVVTLDPAGRVAETFGVTRWDGPVFAPPARFRDLALEGDWRDDPFLPRAAGALLRRASLVEGGGVRPEAGVLAEPLAARCLGLTRGAAGAPAPLVAAASTLDGVEAVLLRDPLALLPAVRQAEAILASCDPASCDPAGSDPAGVDATYAARWGALARDVVSRRAAAALRGALATIRTAADVFSGSQDALDRAAFRLLSCLASDGPRRGAQ